MPQSNVPVLDLDFRDSKFAQDPYPIYSELRNQYPIFQLRDGTHVLSRYKDVAFALRRYDLFSSGWTSAPIAHQSWLKEEHQRGNFLTETDPPEHDHYSAMIRGPFVGKGLSEQIPFILEQAKDIASALRPGTTYNFLRTFAYPYFARILDNITGLDNANNIDRTLKWVEMAQSFTSAQPDPAEFPIIEREIAAQNEYYESVVADRRKCPRHDLASVLSNTPVLGKPLSKLQLRSALNLFTIGGVESPALQLTNAFILLSERRDLIKSLQGDPALIGPFIEEMLRFLNITTGVMRISKQPVELHGFVIPEGVLVFPLISSANRDERQFSDPDTFKLNRPNIKTHVGFSHGPHSCIGQSLAREQIRIALEVILSSFSEFKCPPQSDLEWKSTFVGRFVHSLPIQFIQ